MHARIDLFGMTIDALDMNGAVALVRDWARRREPCRYIVTPNVDHVVMYQERADLRRAYAQAGLVLADGAPVVWASRLLRRPLPERVAGSDMVERLLASVAAPDRLRLFLLGAMPGVAERAADRIERQWPQVSVVGTLSPPLGFEKSAEQTQHILNQVNAAQADVLVLGFGAPKQELWIAEHFEQIQCPVAICAGATIDFLAGEKRRAPHWARRCGLEWLHRLSSEPRRLFQRYFRDALRFPPLVWKAWRQSTNPVGT